jgi:poly(A) polymerase
MSERKDLIDLAKTFEPKVFPVGGKDLISLGIKPGPNMGVILQRLKTAWFKSRFTLNKFDLLKMVNV